MSADAVLLSGGPRNQSERQGRQLRSHVPQRDLGIKPGDLSSELWETLRETVSLCGGSLVKLLFKETGDARDDERAARLRQSRARIASECAHSRSHTGVVHWGPPDSSSEAYGNETGLGLPRYPDSCCAGVLPGPSQWYEYGMTVPHYPGLVLPALPNSKNVRFPRPHALACGPASISCSMQTAIERSFARPASP